MSRTLAFLYGIIAYLVFFVAFLYAVGFVNNLLVPKGIDDGAATGTAEAAVVNLLLLSLFAVQHSVMARPAFKRWWTRVVPEPVERSTYVLLSSLILLLLFWQWRPMTGVIWATGGAAAGVLWALYAVGWGIVLLSTLMIGHFELFGLQQVYQHLTRAQPRAPSFITPGFYRIVRHPIMTGFIVAFWAAPVMTTGHLLFAAVTTAYILLAVRLFEEPELVEVFGERYREYQRQVPGFVPIPKRRRADRKPKV